MKNDAEYISSICKTGNIVEVNIEYERTREDHYIVPETFQLTGTSENIVHSTGQSTTKEFCI